jgi:hypothetical protein
LRASAVEISISANQQRTGPTLDDGGECRIDFVFRTGTKDIHSQPKDLRGGLRFGVDGPRRRRTFRVHQDGNRAGMRNDLMQQFEPLCDVDSLGCGKTCGYFATTSRYLQGLNLKSEVEWQ